MKYASVCSGVEAASLAWIPLGWEAVWFSEIDPFPCAVLKERFPNVPNIGDMTKIEVENMENGDQKFSNGNGADVVVPGGVDLLVGGTPCQSFSVAGKREGLEGASGLAKHFVRLLREMRPRWFVWENVPGALSSRTNGQFDFNFLLNAYAECGYSCAWRILDAQYVRVDGYPRAVPQRRRRVFVVGHLGDWRYPASVLFEPGCLPGNTPPRRVKGEGVAADAKGSIRETGDGVAPDAKGGNNEAGRVFWNRHDYAETLKDCDRDRMPDKGRLQCVIEPRKDSVVCLGIRQVVYDTDLAPTLIATDYKGGKAIYYENHAQDSRIKETDCSPVLSAKAGTGGGNLPLVKEPDVIGFIKNDAGGEQQGFWVGVCPTVRCCALPAVAYNVTFCDANGTRKDRRNGGLYVTKAETSQTVTAKGPHTEAVIIALDGDKMAKAERKGGSGLGVSEDGVMYTLTAKDVHAVAYDECVPLDLRNATHDPEKHDAQNRQGVGVGEDGAPMNTVTATSVPGIGWQATVRKLLPVECERLMGFPDNWTMIPWRGKPAEQCPDSPRYNACGNSMCVNVMRWIGMRIEMAERKMRSNHEKEN